MSSFVVVQHLMIYNVYTDSTFLNFDKFHTNDVGAEFRRFVWKSRLDDNHSGKMSFIEFVLYAHLYIHFVREDQSSR